MSAEDLDRGLKLARLAGEFGAVSDVIALVQLPMLAALMERRGENLQNIAVVVIL